MAEHLYTHEQVMLLVQMGKADAWEHGVRDAVVSFATGERVGNTTEHPPIGPNPYREVVSDGA